MRAEHLRVRKRRLNGEMLLERDLPGHAFPLSLAGMMHRPAGEGQRSGLRISCGPESTRFHPDIADPKCAG